MLEVGAIVVYGSEGVCKIIEIQKRSFSGIDVEKQYYVLEPMDNLGGKLYVPVDNEVLTNRMKKLLSYDELTKLIASNFEQDWVTDNKLRNKLFKDTLANYDRQGLFAIAKKLYKIKNGNCESVKKLYSMDEDILRKISHILYQELSFLVRISQEEVLPFICGEIVCDKK